MVGVFHNTTNATRTLDLSVIPDVSFSGLEFISADPEAEASLEGTILTLGPQTSAILR